MKEETKTIFVSDDGSRFETKEDALLWDQIFHRVKDLKKWGVDCKKNDLPKELLELKDVKDVFNRYLPNSKDIEVFFSEDELEGHKQLDRLRSFNYLMNYIFYESPHPCSLRPSFALNALLRACSEIKNEESSLILKKLEKIDKDVFSPSEVQTVVLSNDGWWWRDSEAAFGQTVEILEIFKNQKSLILDLRATDPDIAQRAIDFVAGANKMINGYQARISESVFFLSPRGGSIGELEFNAQKEIMRKQGWTFYGEFDEQNEGIIFDEDEEDWMDSFFNFFKNF
tara:strand:- start:6592 stop:7443 length:852 start_codon:yes stop_codon:yes gene_type:complete